MDESATTSRELRVLRSHHHCKVSKKGGKFKGSKLPNPAVSDVAGFAFLFTYSSRSLSYTFPSTHRPFYFNADRYIIRCVNTSTRAPSEVIGTCKEARYG